MNSRITSTAWNPKHRSSPHAASPRRESQGRRAPAGRALHLIDIENLMGGPTVGTRSLADAADYYSEAARMRTGDIVVAAANPGLAPWLSDLFPGSQIKLGTGPDGADLALIGAVKDVDFVARRFDRVVIGSGDAIFVDVVNRLSGRGVAVEVVACPTALARSLAHAALVVRYIESAVVGRAA